MIGFPLKRLGVAFAVGCLAMVGAQAQTASLVPNASTYAPSGGQIQLSAGINYASVAAPTALAYSIHLPAGWAFVSVGGSNVPNVVPTAGTTGDLDFAYTAFPANAALFTVTVSYPAGLTGTQVVSASAIYRTPLTTLNVPSLSFTPTQASSAPNIVQHPANLTVTAGQSAAFTVTATGSPAPGYQWRKAGTSILGATAATYTIASAQSSDAGSYDVVVANSLGSITSFSAVLTVTSQAVAPAIVTAPVSQTVTTGGNVTFSVTASGTAPLTYQWRKDGVALAGATTASLTLTAVQPAAAGGYTVVVANSAGSVTSSAAALTVNARTPAGAYFGTLGGTGGTFALFVRSDRTGVFLGYARAAKIPLVNLDVVIDANGRFQVGVGSSSPASTASVPAVAAAGTSYVATGTIGADGAVSGTVSGLEFALSAPAPVSGTIAAAGFYRAGASGSSATSYTIVGTAGDAYLVAIAGATADAGKGAVDAAGKVAITTENSATVSGGIQAATISLTVTPSAGAAVVYVGANNDARSDTEKLINISTRSQTGAGGSALIAGFVIAGTQPKAVLVRAVGPTLAQFGLTGFLPAVRLEIFKGATSLAVGGEWGAAANAAEIASTTTRLGGFALPANSRDAALLLTLDPGPYTAVVSGQGTATGVALVEVYDAAAGPVSAAQRVINISSRAAVSGGDAALIGGFYISGAVPKRVLIRGAGPGLAQFGITGALTRPQVTLFKGTQIVAQNAGWSGSPDAAVIAAAASQAGAFGFDAGSADAALIVNLDPGPYTAQVTGVAGTTGVALVEVYEVP